MNTLRISDGELQTLLATAIRKKLAGAGFKTGASMEGWGNPNCAFYFPINLNLSGQCGVQRGADGFWTFSQEDNPIMADRLAATLRAHADAITVSMERFEGS
jgi:hypothetical protein